MPLIITSLNSGSNGNCYYIGNGREGVFIDAGLSCREIEKRMGRLGLDIKKVSAVFVTHEHSDHIFGVPVLAKKYGMPVYITPATLRNSGFELARERVMEFTAHQPIQVGGLAVTAFPKQHDASDPHSFIVEDKNTRVGIFTDIGRACEQVVHHFRDCHAAFLEANYDETMLRNGRYPASLKKRITGGDGHLSNDQALELFIRYRPSYMSHLILAHLSKENNRPELVQELFAGNAGTTEIVVASRVVETPLFHI
ncbi:MAG TPA: MBL fold metallo-hydrolase, partial [Chitinophagaceae bacterium]